MALSLCTSDPWLVDRFNFGPPVGFPVQFRVVGRDPMEVRRIAYDVREIMRANSNTRDPHLDWNEQAPSPFGAVAPPATQKPTPAAVVAFMKSRRLVWRLICKTPWQ